jgi:small subunit ribosomal protein S6
MDKRNYDIGFIINPELTEEEIKKVISSMTQMIEENGGVIEKLDEWGRKRLVYPIQKHKEGIYIFINAEFTGNVVEKIERKLKLNEKIIRFIVVRLDDKLKKSNKLVKKWEKADKRKKKMQQIDGEKSSREESHASSRVKENKNETN